MLITILMKFNPIIEHISEDQLSYFNIITLSLDQNKSENNIP